MIILLVQILTRYLLQYNTEKIINAYRILFMSTLCIIY